MSTLRLVTALLAALARQPASAVTINNCGVSYTYSSAPQRVISMNQGVTEFMLAMGLEGSMVGTAYLDDTIWPRYATAYGGIPVLSSNYPNESHIMAQNPDFIIGSYNSAFRARYARASDGALRGVFNVTVDPCTGTGSEWDNESEWTTCRPQLHARGIGTYLADDACEDQDLRPATVTEETVYAMMRSLGRIFRVDPEPKITEMRGHFDTAAALVPKDNAGQEKKLKTVWLDCVGRCCQTEAGQEEQVFVGGGTGAPNLLMREAGLKNIFANREGNWVCVNVSDIVAAAPEVIVVVDAAWDTAASKIEWLYDDAAFCQMEVVRAARFVTIPFSATTLSPRNGPAAVDLAVAALHVKTGSQTPALQSGVASFSPFFLQSITACRRCPLLLSYVIYDDASDSAQNYQLCTSTSTMMEVDRAAPGLAGLGLGSVLAVGVAAAMRLLAARP